jgi:hypothetical protein
MKGQYKCEECKKIFNLLKKDLKKKKEIEEYKDRYRSYIELLRKWVNQF